MLFKWHIVGDGNDMPLLKRLVISNEVEDCVVIEGKQDNPYPYMKHADVYVCTSAYEAFPLVFKESFLCGVPVVTTPIPPAREIIEPGKNGVIVNGFRPEDITKEIMKLYEKPKMIVDMKSYILTHQYKYADDVTPFIELCEEIQ